MTGATRSQGVNHVFQLLELVGVQGLELLTSENLPSPHPDAAEYKTLTRLIHWVSIVCRACYDQRLLDANPLAAVSHETFAESAKREFCAPEEIEKIRDLTTVDLKNPRQVADRLVVLLFLDLAVRRNELAGVLRSDIKAKNGDTFVIRLRSEVQKMTGKRTIDLETLYPETGHLLRRYLRLNAKPTSKADAVFFNKRGEPATGEILAQAVKREAQRIGLKCYHSGETPGCHALRRTFASCNAAPLGLGISPDGIAYRLRIAIGVAYEHYIQNNPLMSAMKNEAYRARAKPNPRRESGEMVDGLRRLGAPAHLLEALDAWRNDAYPDRSKVLALRPSDCITDEEMWRILGEAWTDLPGRKSLRAYLDQQGAVLHSKGKANMYQRSVIESLATYQLLDDLLGPHRLSRRQLDALLGEVKLVSIGKLRLVAPQDVSAVLRRRNEYLAASS